MITSASNSHHRKYGEPDGKLVIAAVSGDQEAMLSILDFYKGYISSAAIIKFQMHDSCEKVFYDEEFHKDLLQKVIEATHKFRIRR